ncbi:hypothetical protein KSP40_PGU006207 [Platanthera guangdongensis]|uniref:Uncharacterized protein n=1 Tax=Platanthera guangdongensis TaxID=2320717 RepID=A0ABR2MU79_9ASPA
MISHCLSRSHSNDLAHLLTPGASPHPWGISSPPTHFLTPVHLLNPGASPHPWRISSPPSHFLTPVHLLTPTHLLNPGASHFRVSTGAAEPSGK